MRILRGVRVATDQGVQPASVHIEDGRVLAVAAYDEVPRLAQPEELGKSVLMAGLVAGAARSSDTLEAALAGITTLLVGEDREPSFVDEFVYLGRHGLEHGAKDELVHRAEDELQHGAKDEHGLAQRLSIEWSRGRQANESIENLAVRLCLQPAKRAGIHDRKGRIAVGCDADFVIWNPELTVVGGTAPPFGPPNLSLNGPLYGAIRQTILRGRTICKEGQLIGAAFGTRLVPR